MARIRSIKPEFWTSEQIVECSPIARLLFIGLWTHCDDGGVHTAAPRRLKMEVFPADPFTVEQIDGWMTELIEAGLVVEFSTPKGERFWGVTGWHHQRVERPTIRFPSPNDPGMVVERSANTDRRSIVEASTPESSRVEVRGTSLRSVPPAGSASAADTFESAFEAIWRTYPRRAGGNPKRRARQAYAARLRSGGHDHVEILAGVERYAAYCAATGKLGTEYVMQAATFLGPDARFTETWEVTDEARRNGSGARARALSATERVDRANGGPGYDADDTGDATHGGAVEAHGPDVRPPLGGQLRGGR